MATDNVSKVKDPKNSIHAKLTKARLEFSKMDVRKTGVNKHIEFMYFTLQDIVPPIIELQNKHKFLINMYVNETDLGNRFFVAEVINSEDPEDYLTFSAPFEVPTSKVSKSGNELTTSTQNVGSAITYMRRYMYFLIFDIIEADVLDETAGRQEVESKRPATTEKKAEVQTKLAGAENQAPNPLIASLKKKLKELVDVDPSQKQLVAEIVEKTENFKKITRKECEGFIHYANAAIEQTRE